MTATPDQMSDQTRPQGDRIVISVDAMGGDAGPGVVVAGMAKSAKKNPDIGFILHGPEKQLKKLVARRRILAGRVSFRDASDVVTMEDKPSHVMRHGKSTSMWSTLAAVRDRLARAKGTIEDVEQGIETQDPSGNRIRIIVEA